MKSLINILTVVGTLALTGSLRAEKEMDTKFISGKVVVVTDGSVTVDDHLYRVGEHTRVTKNGMPATFKDLKAGDVVTIDTRGKDSIDPEVAAIKILSPDEAPGTVVKEKDTVIQKERIKVQDNE